MITEKKFIIFQFDKHTNVLSSPIIKNSPNKLGEELRSPEIAKSRSVTLYLYDTCAKFAFVQINLNNGIVITKGGYEYYNDAINDFEKETYDFMNVKRENNYAYGMKGQYLYILVSTENDKIMEKESFSYDMENKIKSILENFAFRMRNVYNNVFECAKYKRFVFDRKDFSLCIYKNDISLFYKKAMVAVFNVSDKKHIVSDFIVSENTEMTEWGFDYIVGIMEKNEKDIKKLNEKLKIFFD